AASSDEWAGMAGLLLGKSVRDRIGAAFDACLCGGNMTGTIPESPRPTKRVFFIRAFSFSDGHHKMIQ
ncbi:hypothetical protein, partial [Burkholderia gladioli]|uniref:hypothetical protein n=1 Tax=Burkholderia gladioli TaxID=28095 RepID=UPI003F7A35CF